MCFQLYTPVTGNRQLCSKNLTELHTWQIDRWRHMNISVDFYLDDFHKQAHERVCVRVHEHVYVKPT